MSLANRLTVLRVILVPVFVALFLGSRIPHNYMWALIAFLLACLTDMLDGYIARSRGQVSDFGILMDPLADKLMVTSAMVCFIPVGLVGAVIVIIILAREFLVTSIRTLAAGKGRIIAADKWGKLKTVIQMVWIGTGLMILWLFSIFSDNTDVLKVLWECRRAYDILTALTTAVTVLSGLNYIIKNRSLFMDTIV